MTRALPYAGLAFGTISTVLGTAQLSALWQAPEQIHKDERIKVGAFGVGLILMGVTLTALSGDELRRKRK